MKRVAVKRFRYPVDDALAASFQACIEALRARGVKLPKMFMMKLEDGAWVQVSQLFGSLCAGSKLAQPSMFYRGLPLVEQRFAADQLTRVALAGYLPSVDLFLVFRGPDRRLIPLDLDLIRPEPSVERRACELVKRLIHLGGSAAERDDLKTVVLGVADPPLAQATERCLVSGTPLRRIWDRL